MSMPPPGQFPGQQGPQNPGGQQYPGQYPGYPQQQPGYPYAPQQPPGSNKGPVIAVSVVAALVVIAVVVVLIVVNSGKDSGQAQGAAETSSSAPSKPPSGTETSEAEPSTESSSPTSAELPTGTAGPTGEQPPTLVSPPPQQTSAWVAATYNTATNQIVWATSTTSADAAVADVMRRCSGCSQPAWSENYCVAVAIGNRGWGADWGHTPDEAGGKAQSRARSYGASAPFSMWSKCSR